MMRIKITTGEFGQPIEQGFVDEPSRETYVYDSYRIWHGEVGFYWDDADRSFPTLTACAADIEATLRAEAMRREAGQ